MRVSVPRETGGTEGGVKTIDRCEHRDRGNWQYAPERNEKMTKRTERAARAEAMLALIMPSRK